MEYFYSTFIIYNLTKDVERVFHHEDQSGDREGASIAQSAFTKLRSTSNRKKHVQNLWKKLRDTFPWKLVPIKEIKHNCSKKKQQKLEKVELGACNYCISILSVIIIKCQRTTCIKLRGKIALINKQTARELPTLRWYDHIL